MSSPAAAPSGKRSRSPSLAEDDFSLKRTRVDDEIEEMLQLPEEHKLDGPLVKDDTYYLHDGSCIMRVENTLFNVHQTLLAKDGSLFSSMFSLPQGKHEVEGASDDSPIWLQGESVAEFKNFLWVLYALPHELADISTPQIDLPRLNRLIDIARVSFKYHFRSIETWALDVINEQVNRKPTPPLFYLPSSATSAASPQAIASNGALISRLMRLAQLCAHERLLAAMIGVMKQLMGYSIQYAHLAMSLADELELRPLRGIAYFEVMQKANVVVAAPSRRPSNAAARSPSSLAGTGTEEEEPLSILDAEGRLIVNPQQKMRLLMGYHRLTMVWERLRATPLTYEHAAACSATWHQHGCTQCWLDFWKEKTKSDTVLSLGLADVLGRLRAISKEFVRWGSATYMHQDCRTTVRNAIQEKIKMVEDALPDYFVEETYTPPF
ncbi:hypothetical protein PHLGIDRAFT_101543 [Phlebiopsis gigantea 11061_1 CR5-6]|uniref:BTB domain-containing protein n=1 Tax=Phlebiopsis gigantea (strain 11061_1 CR5-6) TaxID=745531 RepID=A0A0C3SE41_PHLG1|nr:hypothetical protein PHLGIDRAFT_101543 [Phlebiopsis gigantea 11061_1 CR5-6]